MSAVRMSFKTRRVFEIAGAVIFFASILCTIFGETTIASRKFSEEFFHLTIPSLHDGDPGRLLDTLHCPGELARGEEAAITASITNPGATADYVVKIWDDDMYRSEHSTSSNSGLCSTTVHILAGETAETACNITAPQEDTLLQLVIWAVSSEDTGHYHLGFLPNSYFGICQIHIGAYTTDYLSTLSGGLGLVGIELGAVLWLLTRRWDRKLVTLSTCMAAVMGILVWIPPLWYEILRVEADTPFLVYLAPNLALIIGAILFFITILHEQVDKANAVKRRFLK